MPQIPYVKQTWTDVSSSASAARLTVIENGVYEAHLQQAVRVYLSRLIGTVTGYVSSAEDRGSVPSAIRRGDPPRLRTTS